MQRLQAAECTSGPLGPFRGYPGCHHPLRRTLGGRLASTLCLGTAATRGCWAVLYNGTRYTCIHNTLARPLPFPPAPQNSQSPMLDGQRPGRTRSRPRPARKTASHHATTTHWAVVSAPNKPPHRQCLHVPPPHRQPERACPRESPTHMHYIQWQLTRGEPVWPRTYPS